LRGKDPKDLRKSSGECAKQYKNHKKKYEPKTPQKRTNKLTKTKKRKKEQD